MAEDAKEKREEFLKILRLKEEAERLKKINDEQNKHMEEMKKELITEAKEEIRNQSYSDYIG